MTADLNMGGPQRVINLIDPVIARDAAKEKNVDTLKVEPMITIWAEGTRSIDKFQHIKFSFSVGDRTSWSLSQ